MSELKKSGFFYQLKDYGINRILKSYDFLLSFTLFIILLQSYLTGSNNFKSLSNDSLTGIITIAATIFSIIIAALAIILSFSGTKFVQFLRDNGRLHNILFLFWLCSVTYLSVLMLAFIKYLVNFHVSHIISSLYNALLIAGFVYAVLQTFYVVASIMKFAHYLDYHDKNK
jgi:hypothetical protein